MNIKKIIINKYFVYLSFVVLFSGAMAVFGGSLVFAQSCPTMTTVSGTTVNFVGELTDMGGDSSATVWFEYGQTIGYGLASSQKILSHAGIYCVAVSGLSPCVTYNYRAVAQNSAGTSYGENKTFTTSCGPTVNLTANGSDGPLNVAHGDSVTLSWVSQNANSCQAFGDWTGSKATFGSQPVYNITSSRNFSITCTGPAGSASDNVVVNVNSPSLAVSLFASPSSGCAPLSGVDLTASVSGNSSGNFTYSFDCANDGYWDKIVTVSSHSYIAVDVCNFNSPGSYTAKVKVEASGVSAQNSAAISVSSCQAATSTLAVKKWVRNLSTGSAWLDSVPAAPSEVLSFFIEAKAVNSSFQNVIVKDVLPDKMTFISDSLKIDGVSSSGDIFAGINLGTLSAGQKKTVTFNVQLASAENFAFGNTQLVNSAVVSDSSGVASVSSTAAVIVGKTSVAGAATVAGATAISTGLTNNPFIDSFLIPSLIALLLVWFFKSNIIKWEQWLDTRKEERYQYKTNKLLQQKIGSIRVEEWNKRSE